LKLYVVGTGPGSIEEMTAKARATIESCEVVVGYEFYIELVRELLHEKKIISTGMTREIERCKAAIDEALKGKSVCVISGGDAGVYGMAGLLLELAEPYPHLEIEVIPGVTAACSAAAVLGAPLCHDFAVISLSDRLTDWEIITKRLQSAAQGDFIISLYNPASKTRKLHLKKACEIIMHYRSPKTVCGIVRNVGRDGEKSIFLSLNELADYDADMFTTIIIGNSGTRLINGRLVTPRGYDPKCTDGSDETVSPEKPKVIAQENPERETQKADGCLRFPLFMKLVNKEVLIVGGGKVATRRARVLLDFGAAITVVSPEICRDMQEIAGSIKWIKQDFENIEKGFSLVIAATNDREVNKKIGENAKGLGIPVSVADRKEESTFWFPAIAKGNGIVAGIVSETGDHFAVKETAIKVRTVLRSQVTPHVQSLQIHSDSVGMDAGARELTHGRVIERKRMYCSD